MRLKMRIQSTISQLRKSASDSARLETEDQPQPVHLRMGSARDSYGYLLVLYLERPAAQVRSCMDLAGRVGFSDLKEAAPVKAYVL